MGTGRNWIALICASAALAACGTDETSEGTAGEEQEGVQAMALTPGEYETKVELIDFDMPDMPGAPGNMGDMMKRSFETSYTYCLTPEEASADALAKARREAQEQMEKSGECTVERENNSRETIDMTIACDTAQGKMNMTMTGGMTDEGMTMRMKADGDMGGQKMSFTTEHVSRRIGDCAEDESKS